MKDNVSFCLTPAQIRAIFDRGFRAGENAATAFEWGSSAHCNVADEIVEFFIDEGIFSTEHCSWKQLAAIFKED